MFNEWQDSLRVESVITKSTHFVALLEYPRNSPHRAAWVSFLTSNFWVAIWRIATFVEVSADAVN
jgi:hypothetical protein